MKGAEKQLPFIMRFRWFFVIVFLFPMSVVFDLYWALCARLRRGSAPERHKARVSNIQEQVLAWKKSGSTQRLCTTRPAFMSMSLRPNLYKNVLHKVKVDLPDILSVDTENRLVHVEPMVTVGQLSHYLIPQGWTLAVLPELDDLSVGGLLMGTGIETSSHKYGLFHDICTQYEVCLADGSVVKVTETEHADLFRALPWSYGTLGLLLSAHLRIVPCKPFVRLRYFPCNTREKALETFESMATQQSPPEFVEGLMYSPTSAVIMTGDFSDAPPTLSAVNRIGRWYKPWFYTHVEKTLTSGPKEEYIPLRDYYHRHTRSIFWEMRDIIWFGNSFLFRVLLGWVLPMRVSLLKLTTPKKIGEVYEKIFVFQDMLVPIKDLDESLTVFHDNFNIYPLWLCPHTVNKYSVQGLLRAPAGGQKTEMFVDIGAYGMADADNFDCRSALRRVEAFVTRKRGYQMLYADSYMTKEEFGAMFDRTLYDKMREKYGALAAFPDVYDKIRKY